MTRKRHTDLEPLATNQDSTSGPHRSASTPSSITSTNVSALPSPSVLAARAWFLQISPPIGQNFNAIQRRRTLIEAQEFPRRHSIIPSPGSLTTTMAGFTVSSHDQNLEVVPERAEVETVARSQDSEDITISEVKQDDLLKLTAVATAVKSKPPTFPVADVLSRVPFHYTHARLRDWGHAYLGNIATADAFINAVSLRRPSLALVKEDSTDDQPQLTRMVTIRARVLPKAKERKAFLIQRKFDVEELRASTSAVQRPTERLPTPLRRSNRRSSTHQVPNKSPRRESQGKSPENLASFGKGAVPIHIEYALHFLPILAALLLSGHVRRGDTVDLPVPCPEAWRSMITYIYTGKDEMNAGVKDNILYLAGNAG